MLWGSGLGGKFSLEGGYYVIMILSTNSINSRARCLNQPWVTYISISMKVGRGDRSDDGCLRSRAGVPQPARDAAPGKPQ